MNVPELTAYLKAKRGITAEVVTEASPDGRAYGRFVENGNPWPRETTFAIRPSGNVFDLAFFKTYKDEVVKVCDAAIYANLSPQARREKGYGPASLVPVENGGHVAYAVVIDALDAKLRQQRPAAVEPSIPLTQAPVPVAVSVSRPKVPSAPAPYIPAKTAPTANELRQAHEEYKRTVPNSYLVTIHRVAAALSHRSSDELATALAKWLQDLNRQYYRFRPKEAATLSERLKPLVAAELESLLGFRQRSLKTVTKSDEGEVLRLFVLFRTECGPVGAGKALHVMAPNCFPLWDNAIADSYGIATETGYFQFMGIVRQQVLDLPAKIAPSVTALKALDEYNYLKASAKRRPRS